MRFLDWLLSDIGIRTVEGVTRHFPPERPPPIHPVEISLTDRNRWEWPYRDSKF